MAQLFKLASRMTIFLVIQLLTTSINKLSRIFYILMTLFIMTMILLGSAVTMI